MVPNTTLAKSYIERNNGQFHSTTCTDYKSESYEEDNYGNKIYVCDIEKYEQCLETNRISVSTARSAEADRKIFSQIAKSIEDDANLFAQLEYLIRNVKIEDVKNYDIKLIAKRFQYFSSRKPVMYSSGIRTSINVYASKPLAALGFVAEVLSVGHDVTILCNVNMAVVCNLFVEICHRCGFSTSSLQCLLIQKLDELQDSAWRSGFLVPLRQGESGSVAIVTEKANMESAVDCLVDSTTDHRYPWRLRRIIVQESVAERFNKALQQKIERLTSPLDDLEVRDGAWIASKADDVYYLQNKTFLVDFHGSSETVPFEKPFVLIESYRTTKELLSLLKKYLPHYISLWCNDGSVTNEIAFGTKSYVIWVNDYGKFEGPNEVGHCFFNGYDFQKLREHLTDYSHSSQREIADINPMVRPQKLVKLRADWMKIDGLKRRNAIHRALDKYLSIYKDQGMYFEAVKKAKDSLLDWESLSFVHIDSGNLCTELLEPMGVVLLKTPCFDSIVKHFDDLIKSVVNGNGFLVEMDSENDLIDVLEKENIPIIRSSELDSLAYPKLIDLVHDDYKDGHHWTALMKHKVLYRKKVIWSQFGETFAN